MNELKGYSNPWKMKVSVLEKNAEWHLKKNNIKHHVARFTVSDGTTLFYLTVLDDEIGKMLKNINKTIILTDPFTITPKKRLPLSYKLIKDLTPSQRLLKILAKIIEISDVRKIKLKRDNTVHKVADFLIADVTGCIILVLWDDWITKISGYNIVKIENAYVTKYKNGLRLNLYRNGSIEETDESVEEFFSNINLWYNLSA